MMMALHGNGVKTIIIEKLDRLARDLMVQEATIADLGKHEFSLISVAEPDLRRMIPLEYSCDS
jgi:DNA invertase Pin-like site-specific DNA recombinase